MKIKIVNQSKHPLPEYGTIAAAGVDLRANIDSPITLKPLIDADYRGELRVILINLSNEAFVIEDGERIAQMVIAAHEQADWVEVDSLEETARGAGGFGSTGVK